MSLPLQPDRVMEFCRNNDLQLIVRAHECVMDGFERFAQGHLITLFSATNYCGKFSLDFCTFPWDRARDGCSDQAALSCSVS